MRKSVKTDLTERVFAHCISEATGQTVPARASGAPAAMTIGARGDRGLS